MSEGARSKEKGVMMHKKVSWSHAKCRLREQEWVSEDIPSKKSPATRCFWRTPPRRREDEAGRARHKPSRKEGKRKEGFNIPSFLARQHDT